MGRREGYRWQRGAWQPTDRQREVLDLVLEGKSNAEIALRLGISVDGAKWHVSELLSQTGCADRQALAAWWRRERGQKPGWAVLPWSGLQRVVVGSVIAGAGLVAVVLAVALLSGDRGGASETADAGQPSPTPWAPTPWPEESLEELAAQQGPAPASCEPPKAQDLRIVDASELLAQGLEPAGLVIISGHCPLYVANRADRAVVWVGGGGLLHFDPADDSRLMTASRCCMSGFLTAAGASYRVSGYAYEPSGRLPFGEGFSVLNSTLAAVGAARGDGSYVMLGARTWDSGMGPVHGLAVSSDGQVFIDPAALADELVLNHLTGEEIDVSNWPKPGMHSSVSSGSVRTDCWAEEGACKVYLDGVGGTREGDTGVFNPPVMLAPFDGVLSCVQDDGGWSVDGPAQAYELSNGALTVRIGAFGGAWEEWEACQPRDVRRGQEIEVWTFTYIEGFVSGEPISVVATRDGRLYFGDFELTLDCPCEYRS